MIAPTIETDRLLLRPFTLNDFPAYAALWADPDVIRYIGGTPRSEEDSWLRFHTNEGYWRLHGAGFWAITDKATGAFLGQTGFMKNRRGLQPDISEHLEMGWVTASAAAGKGYGREAAKAVVRWGDARFGRPTLACIIHPDNAPSLRIAATLGFEVIATTLYHGDPTLVMLRDGAS